MDVFAIGLLVLSILTLWAILSPDVRLDGPLFTLWNVLYGIGYLAIVVGAKSISENMSTCLFRQEPLETGDGNALPAAHTSLLPVRLNAQTLKYAVPIALGILCSVLNILGAPRGTAPMQWFDRALADTLKFIHDQILPVGKGHDDPKAWTSHITLLIVAVRPLRPGPS